MSESKRLDEWFPNGRGDGRKFVIVSSYKGPLLEPFEPVIRCLNNDGSKEWFGLRPDGKITSFATNTFFQEWIPHKKKKKVKMYRAIVKSTTFDLITIDLWRSEKETYITPYMSGIVGWEEREIEVDDE